MRAHRYRLLQGAAAQRDLADDASNRAADLGGTLDGIESDLGSARFAVNRAQLWPGLDARCLAESNHYTETA